MWGQRFFLVFRRAAFGLPVAVAFLDCVAYVAKVEGVSMQPELNPEPEAFSDYVLLNRWASRSCEVQRGEVVAIKSPRDPTQRLIKRVVAVEGDTVRTMGYHERLMTVPRGHCWLEGDNHAHSLDSNRFGPVALGLLVARASHRVWPPSRWGRLESRQPEPGRLLLPTPR
ncbi:mitochondrial inner membrane protease subunit 2 [Dermacentor variabilis]|uniref:mitochondrial inner membrane protease subunit 2 n=1 Tax=Dermacentor variabilis TaxID=34621 RepID=UPI003F5C9A13